MKFDLIRASLTAASRLAHCDARLPCAIILLLAVAGCSQKPNVDQHNVLENEIYKPATTKSEKNIRALTAFGEVYGIMMDYMPPVEPRTLVAHALQGIQTDPRMSDATDRAVIASAINELEAMGNESSRREQAVRALTPFGRAVEVLSAGNRRPSVTTLVERGLVGMASGLDAETYFIPPCDSEDELIREERAGKIGLEGIGLRGRVVICPKTLASGTPSPAVSSAGSVDPAFLPAQAPPPTALPIFGALLGPYIYLRLNRINDGEDGELHAKFSRLRDLAKGYVRGVIIDLRSSDGGLLTASQDVAGLFLNAGSLIARTDAVSPANRQQFNAYGADITGGLPIIVIVSHRTAAGAEIIAGALQDNRRAIIVGGTTYGNGSIQTVVPSILQVANLLIVKSFLLLFFKKEELPSLSYAHPASCTS
jgi:hypothetical protein